MQAQRDTKVINKPLTILGAEQKLFFTALIMDAAAFNLFGSLLVFGRIPGAKLVPLEGRNHLKLANDPAHRSFLNAVFSFLGDPPIKGVLPGGEKFKGRLENIVKGLEQNWFIKLMAILAAIAGVLLFAEEVWRILRR